MAVSPAVSVLNILFPRVDVYKRQVMNILDDTILKDMAAQNRVDLVRERWINYAEILEKMGADAVLSACSKVGPFRCV